MKCKAFCVVTEHGTWSACGGSGINERSSIEECYSGCFDGHDDGDEYRVIELDFELPDDLFKRQSVTAKATVRDAD